MIMILAVTVVTRAPTAGAFFTAKKLRYEHLANDYNVGFHSDPQSPCSGPCDLDQHLLM
jgi:hypothetical protein